MQRSANNRALCVIIIELYIYGQNYTHRPVLVISGGYAAGVPNNNGDNEWTEVQYRRARFKIRQQMQKMLADNDRMTPDEMRRLLDLVRAGQVDITYHLPLHDR